MEIREIADPLNLTPEVNRGIRRIRERVETIKPRINTDSHGWENGGGRMTVGVRLIQGYSILNNKEGV